MKLPTAVPVLVALLVSACGGGGGGGAENQPPVAALTLDVNRGPAPLTVAVDSAGSRDPDGRIDQVLFDFGDGQSRAAASAFHTYLAPGTFTLRLTVTDDRGATGSVTRLVTVESTDPDPDPPPVPARASLVPGSNETLHGAVATAIRGSGATQYHLFTPSSPVPASAPVVVFLHGYTAVDPATYQAFIDHIVKRGNIVVFPRYQTLPISVDTQNFTPNAISAIGAALTELGANGPVAPETSRLAVLGHSLGGVISANVAALAAQSGLPAFRAVMAMEPGAAGSVYADYSLIPAGTLLLSIAGEEDTLVFDTDAKRIFNGATSVSFADRDYLILRSDRTHAPALVADHLAPLAATEAAADAFDRQGFWKWFDGLVAASFYGTFREYALSDTTEQRNMGAWPDQAPIREPVVTDAP